MKPSVRKAVTLLLCSATSAFAASGAEGEGYGVLFWLFVGFGATIVAFQFIPGIMMFLGMARGLFTLRHKTEEMTDGKVNKG